MLLIFVLHVPVEPVPHEVQQLGVHRRVALFVAGNKLLNLSGQFLVFGVVPGQPGNLIDSISLSSAEKCSVATETIWRGSGPVSFRASPLIEAA